MTLAAVTAIVLTAGGLAAVRGEPEALVEDPCALLVPADLPGVPRATGGGTGCRQGDVLLDVTTRSSAELMVLAERAGAAVERRSDGFTATDERLVLAVRDAGSLRYRVTVPVGANSASRALELLTLVDSAHERS